MALIRLRVCAVWSEPLLVAHTIVLEIACRGSLHLINYTSIFRNTTPTPDIGDQDLNSFPAEYFYVLDYFLIFNLLSCSSPILSMYSQSELNTLWILIRRHHQKPADLDSQCFQKG